MTDDRRLARPPEPDEYTVVLRCGCGDSIDVTRYHRNDPYSALPYRCPNCVTRERSR